LLALIGVAILTIYGGVFPYIALILATSFATYGVIRKQAVVGAIPGLVIETAVLFIPAAAFLIWLGTQSTLSFGTSPGITGLLLLAGPVTVLPLWAFAIAARKLKLSTLGMLQYIGPTGQFICALYYGESFTTAHGWCFGLIWIGIVIYSYDAYQNRTRA
jgi:chloramphenicol-sensitive protein RarD